VQRDLEQGEVVGDASGAPPLPSATKAGPPPSVWSEVRPMIKLGWPMIISQYLDRSSQQLCVMLIGHIGPEELGSVVLATMWCECATANASQAP
jgi:Na+-driven multidrug efflux pump